MRWFRSPLAVLALAMLAACQPVPQPNKPDVKARTFGGLLDLGPRAGMTVAPVSGLQGELGGRFADALAAALRSRDVAASARAAHRSSFLLQGEVRPEPPEKGLVRAVFLWRVVDPRGLEISRAEQVEVFEASQWPPADATRLRALAAASAEAVGRMIGLDPSIAPPAVGAAVAVHAVAGAPGDGNRALALAMRRALRAQGVAIAESASDARFVLQGAVRIAETTRAGQKIEIEWLVFGPDGDEVGSTAQANVVPTGSLDAYWGVVAEAAAEAGAEGILRILRSGPKDGEPGENRPEPKS